jgi:3-oxoacyl-[acyl-carrier protein] reductase
MKTDRRVALVTGGTRGIGLGIAEALAREGFDLVVTGRRSPEEAQSAVDSLLAVSPTDGRRVHYLRADVAVATEREQLLVDIESTFGRLDVLINNAGIAPKVRADVLDATEDSFDEIIGTNLKGPYFLTQAVARWMLRQQALERAPRCIINISSVSATVASISRGDYCISKAGIAMATQLWATRLTSAGIGVYEVRPGIIETDMTKTVKGKYDVMIEGGLLLEKRWGTPEDVGNAVAVLATGRLPYSPGAVLLIDGGLTVPRL